tara:strand:+ start:168 stop:557 length:390 start_codon:yes stop_codon:yes gene_type:complete
MTPIEIIALIFASIAIVKMVVLIINHKTWMKIPDFVVKYPLVLGFLYLALAVLFGYYLLQVMTFVQLFVAIMFGAILIGLTWITDADALERILAPYKKMARKEFLKKYWIELILWLAISLYVVYAVLLA